MRATRKIASFRVGAAMTALALLAAGCTSSGHGTSHASPAAAARPTASAAAPLPRVVITPANNADAAQSEAAHKIYRGCQDLGLDALLDDRDERPGVKFKDADLIGVPFRVVVGKKLASGMVELVERRGKKSQDVAVTEAAEAVRKLVR